MRASVRELFSPDPGVTYLDSATYGLPPAPTVAAMDEALRAWQAGTADWVPDWDRPAEATRASFGRIVGAPPEQVALLPAVSVGVGVIAAALGSDDEVVVPDDEFTSLLFPLLVAEQQGVKVRRVGFDALVDAIEPGTTLVAVSLVQMQTGRVVALKEILDRAQEVGARVLLDATHGVPFVPLTEHIDRIDYLVCAAYKHLLCPRGVAFLVAGPDTLGALPPWNANWRAADDPYNRYFGGSLTLPDAASRLDVSLAWLPWVGAVPSLELLAGWSKDGTLEEVRQLAGVLAAGVGETWGGSSLVCVPVADGAAARSGLLRAGVKAAARGTSIRLSPHVYNDEADVERAAAAIAPFIEGR